MTGTGAARDGGREVIGTVKQARNRQTILAELRRQIGGLEVAPMPVELQLTALFGGQLEQTQLGVPPDVLFLGGRGQNEIRIARNFLLSDVTETGRDVRENTIAFASGLRERKRVV